MKKLLKSFIGLFIILVCLSGCSSFKEYTCDRCNDTFRGTAYTDLSGERILCESCATRYWSPLPISEHKY